MSLFEDTVSQPDHPLVGMSHMPADESVRDEGVWSPAGVAKSPQT